MGTALTAQTVLVSLAALAICSFSCVILVSREMLTPSGSQSNALGAEVTGAKTEAIFFMADALKMDSLLHNHSSSMRGYNGRAGTGIIRGTSTSTASGGSGVTSGSVSDADKKAPDNKPVSNKLDAKHHRELVYLWSAKPKRALDLHFIHIPKCGGTSMTSILRQVACGLDSERNEDCCTNPGYCNLPAHRGCASILGCVSHIPLTQWIYKALPSITLLREPVSRLLSAWFFRGHSPNSDSFEVRPWFKDIRSGKRPTVTFDEYLDMPEYNNIQTRMLGANRFPYKNVTITQHLYDTAVNALDNMYFIGLQEVYDLSVEIMLRELNYTGKVEILKLKGQPASKKGTIRRQKQAILSNATLVTKINVANAWDRKLYLEAVSRFCTTARRYSDLNQLVLKSGKVHCE